MFNVNLAIMRKRMTRPHVGKYFLSISCQIKMYKLMKFWGKLFPFASQTPSIGIMEPVL